MIRNAITILLCGLLFPLSVAAAHANKRIALIIGNSAYQHAPALPSPTNDARAMAAAFQKAGYDVVSTAYDVGNLDLKRAIRQFEDAAADSDIAVVYFAGHGIEIHGVNYVIPVDAKLATDLDAESEAIPLDRLIESVDGAKRLRLIILDACRDNPFARTIMQRPNTPPPVTRRPSASNLAPSEPRIVDTLIAYAAKAGSTTVDDQGDHSPFAIALLDNLFVPGLDIRLAFGRVRDEVLKKTGNRQEPFVYGALSGGIIALVPAPEHKSGAVDDPEGVKSDFNLIEKIGTKGAWQVFLDQHPAGFYADLARQQLAKLDGAAEGRAQTPVKTLKDQLVGHWQLVSDNNGQPISAAARPDRQGSMMLDAGGHYLVIVINAGNVPAVSYYGTYTVNDADSSMTMHIDASSGANAGRDTKQHITLSGDQLIVEDRTSADTSGAIKLTWKRSN